MSPTLITPSMTEKLNKKTGKWKPITKPEDIPATSWAEKMCCAGNEKEINRISKKGNVIKKKILKQMKKEGKTTVKEYYEIKERMKL